MDRAVSQSVLRRHANDCHNGVIPDYVMNVTGVYHGDAMLRQIMCSSRKYPDPYHGGNRKFRGGGGVNGPGNSKGEGGFEAKFTSRWSGK